MTSLPLPPDSSSPSPSPSPHFRPFSRLPIELTQHIIESTVPSYYHSTTYVERQSTLRSLCLTSRLFCRNAQSLLFAIVKISTKHTRKILESTSDAWTKTLEAVFVVEGFENEWLIGIDPQPVFDILVGLRTLVISEFVAAMDITLLAGLPSLTSLRLSDFYVSDPVQPLALPNLAALELIEFRSCQPLAQIFTAHSLPSLRALAVYEVEGSSEDVDGLLVDLLPQLDMLFLDLKVTDDISPELFAKIVSITLFDSAINYYGELIRVENLRLYSLRDSGLSDTLEDVLEDLRRILEHLHASTSETIPRVLYLPRSITTFVSDSVEIKTAREELDRIAKDRELELVFEEQPKEWALDSGLSRDFWKRMKAKKDTEAQ